MDWYTIANVISIMYRVFNWAFFPGFVAYFSWRSFARGTWQRMVCRRVIRWTFPPLLVSYLLGVIYYLIIDELLQVGSNAFCLMIYTFYYWTFLKADEDDDDDWRKLKKKVAAKLRRRLRVLRPAWNPA